MPRLVRAYLGVQAATTLALGVALLLLPAAKIGPAVAVLIRSVPQLPLGVIMSALGILCVVAAVGEDHRTRVAALGLVWVVEISWALALGLVALLTTTHGGTIGALFSAGLAGTALVVLTYGETRGP